MKLICLDRSTFILLALILRQFGLSVFRSGSKTEDISLFFKKNYKNYELLKEKLVHTINTYNLEIDWVDPPKSDHTSMIANFLNRRLCFYESDFLQIIKIYFSGCEIIESGKIEQNERWITLGPKAIIFSGNLIAFKLSKKERKIVNLVEHFEQNEWVGDKYYSIEEAMEILSK